MSNSEFRKMQNELDRIGIATSIQRVSEKRYELYINFELIKVRKQRRSIINAIIKKHKEHESEIL